jgi:tRNA pseudouridine38-40 synthase
LDVQNYRLLIQYEGTRYKGWQSQNSTEQTVQGKLSQVLEKMVGEPVDLQGSGRTDAGVHARGQVANVKLKGGYAAEQILAYLNQYLPEDISVLEVHPVDPRFHSRLNAVGKSYVYRIWNSPIPNVFERRLVSVVEEKLDITAMRKAADLLLGTHDYQSFCAKKMKKSTVRTVRSIDIERIGHEVRLTYTGDGFLYHMVRILSGTLMEVGLHKRSPEEMPQILAAKDREKAGALAPAQGLTLWEVFYE